MAFYHNPVGKQVDIELNATPLSHEKGILADVDRLVPARDLQTFAQNVVYTFYDELEQTAKDHLIEGEVHALLDEDTDFRYQTTKPLPKGIHPNYIGKDAELWQKPMSKEPAIDASQGFVQVWIPEDGQAGFVFLTDGEYDQPQALADGRASLESALD